MRRFLLSFILILVLAVPASAHPGDTDSSGGHTDHSTGEYHYHHGYGAHEHYDIDGDGDVDCPYDFDDHTDRSSGTASSTYSPSSTTQSDYRRGYADGKEDGYSDGFDEGKTFGQTAAEKRGYDEGYAEGNSEGYSSGYSKARILGFLGIVAVSAFAFLLLRHKQNRIDELKREHAYELREVDRELRAVKSERDKLLAQQESIRAECQTQIAQAASNCRKQIQETADLCNAKVAQIENDARKQIQNCFMEYFDPQRRSTLQFPKNIDFHPWGVSCGVRTPERPFGDLTVYRTPNGKCFHTVRGCCGATEPVCVYEERIRYAHSCSKCADYRYPHRDVPDWYREYKLLLGGAFAPRPDAPSQPKPDTEPIIKLSRDQQLRIEMGPAVAAKDGVSPARESAPYERLNDCPERWGKPIGTPSQFKREKPFTISRKVLNDHASRWGVDIYTALQMYNNERKRWGLSPLVLDEEK